MIGDDCLRSLVTSALRSNPDERLSIHQLKQHDFFTESTSDKDSQEVKLRGNFDELVREIKLAKEQAQKRQQQHNESTQS